MGNRWNGFTAAAGLCAVTALLLTGCSGSGSSGASSGAAGQAAPAPRQAAGAAAGAAQPNGTSQGGGSAGAGGSSGTGGPAATAKLTPAKAQLIYTADLTVRVHDLSGAVSQATGIAAADGGYVSNENTTAGPAQPATSTAILQLKVPVASYGDALAKLSGRLGRQVSLRQQAQDVTQQVADTGSRVTSDEVAISQLRTLLGRTGSVADLLSVQNQINSEESDLESLQAQQRALNAETSYATVSLTLLAASAPPARHHRAKRAPSVLAGLDAGWHALGVTVSWLLAVLGAVAPWAVALAALGYLGYRGRRWLGRRRTGPASEPAGD